MTFAPLTMRALGLTSVLALAACTGGQPGMMSDLDWDFRGGGSTLDTTEAARQATAARPSPDANGVISYPGYQVAVARRGDTVGSVAARIGINPAELAGYNAIEANAPLRDGEVLALPRRVAAGGGVAPGGVISGGTVAAAPLPSVGGGAVSVTSIATTALDRVDSGTAARTPAAAAPNDSALGAMAPTRHQVKRGETAFSIARTYNVSARALADWNGLGPQLDVREGQYLMIPTPTGEPPARPVQDHPRPSRPRQQSRCRMR
jgi:LysM repeat protein